MKRKFFCVLAVVGIFFSTEVFAGVYFKTWCGVEGMTVGPECFENWRDFNEYLQELNEGYCGAKGAIWWESDCPVEIDY